MFGRKPKDKSAPQAPGVIVVVDRTVDPHLVVYHDPKSLLAEQYRAFRMNLLALNRAGSPRALLFTSSVKGEGKSITTANVSLSLAERAETKVALVDADFRNPRQGELFGLGRGPGLSELLQGAVPLDRIITPTKVRNLYVIRAGREPRNPSELLGSERLLNLIHALKSEFNYVLFDTPPVHPYTDSSTLSALVDGCVFVIRMDYSRREEIERSIKSIQDAGGQVIGTFLAGVESTEPDRYYDYADYSE